MKQRQNNWYVITGAPCSGKTTLLQKLEAKNFHISYEAARIYIDEEMKKGRTLKDIRKNEVSFQKTVLKLKIELEKNLNKEEIIFFERGIHDSSAYYKLCGVKEDSLLKDAIKNSFYKKVFVLDILSYKKDYARVEDIEQAKKLDLSLEKSYQEAGMNVIRVPVLSLQKRIDFILDRIV